MIHFIKGLQVSKFEPFKSSEHGGPEAPIVAKETAIGVNRALLEEVASLEARAQARERDMIMQALQNQKDRVDTDAIVPLENDMKASIQALKGLRLVEQKDGIMFKSPEQALAVKTAIKATEPMICVLPTGGGKTAIFHVPAFLERSKGLLTVVIVPLVALMDDHIHRLNKRGIPGFKSFQWDGQWYKIGIPQDVSILFVSMETAATTTFLNALKLIESRLARIVVVDEAHLAITWSDFRSDMHKLVYILCCQQQFRQGWRVMLWALLYANNNPHSFVLRCSVGHQQDHLLPALVELLKSTHRKTAS